MTLTEMEEAISGLYDAMLDNAEHFTCTEVDHWASLLRWARFPEDQILDGFIRSHAEAEDPEDCRHIDTSSSASRQHYIDTGRYLLVGEAETLGGVG